MLYLLRGRCIVHKFCIHLESKNWSSGDTFVGVIYLQVDDECFPSEGYTDFSLDIAAQWLPQLRGFVDGARSATMIFKDDPYFMKLRREGDQSLLETCRRWGRAPHVVGSYVITTQQIEELIIELSLKLDNAQRAFERTRGDA